MRADVDADHVESSEVVKCLGGAASMSGLK